MDELVAFVRRCLDEDERVVRQMMAEPGGFYLEAETDSVNIMTVGAYVYRWPPKRVLAEVKAKREILEEVQSWLEVEDEHDPVETAFRTSAGWMVTVLAQPYAGQDGWREEWRADS